MPKQGKQFIPSNKSTEAYLNKSVFGPSVGPSERRRRRKEGKDIEKQMRKDEE